MPVKKDLKRRSSVGVAGGSAKRIKLIRPQIAAVNEGNVVLTLGMNDTGQLGLNTDISQRRKPTVVETIADDIRIICAGGMHTLCVTASGKLMSFGCNDEGALGRQTSDDDDEWTPNYVELGGTVVQVTAGDSHSAALLDDGRVFAWGSFRDSSGSMGLTINGIQRSPLELLPGQNFIKIASGTDHLAMLNDDGQLFTCGCGEQGQLGRVSERASGRDCRQGLGHFLLPALVPFKAKTCIEDVWAAYAATFVKCHDEIMVFGLNNYSQLGFVDNINRFFPVPSPAFAGKTWLQVAGGQHHTLARDSDGRVYSLGRYEYGRLGLGENTGDATVLTIVPALSNKKCVDIACGSVISLAVSDDGLAYGWGMGSNAQLGNDGESDIYEPTPICGNQLEARSPLRVAAGGQHTVLLATPLAK